ncbi:MAG: phosphotransferase [Oscillospiraceae bacterium]|nr:phosphotransferase [Oscillospiraceae bacterium]
MKKLVLKALAEFGINEVESMTRIEDKDMWNIDDEYFIKTYTDFNHLERVLLIYGELHNAGVPVAVYNKINTGELYLKVDTLYYTVMNKATGSHIDYQKEACSFSFGQNMAKLHNGLKNLTDKIQYSGINADLIESVHGWILNEITEKNLNIKKKIIDYCISFDELYHKLPRQIIHRDLHGGNMMFENGELSAFLDFDISEINARLFDVCYCMDLGVGNNINNEAITKWLRTFKSFLTGYNSVSEFTDEELEAIPYMFVSVQLLTTAFFSKVGKSKEFVDEYIEYLKWLYDSRSRFLFSKQDINI